MFKEIDETNKTLPLVLLGGLDDVATERQLTSGWSFAVLPEAAANRFTGAAQKLLPANRTEFHAKEFDTSSAAERKAYSDFLRLLCQEVEATPGSLLACSLNDKSWSANFTGFAERLVATHCFHWISMTPPWLSVPSALPQLSLRCSGYSKTAPDLQCCVWR